MKKWRHGEVTFLVQGAAVRWWQDQYYTAGPCGAKALTLSLCADCLCVDSAATKNDLSYLENQCFICFKIQTLTMAKASLCLWLGRSLQSKCLLA